MRLDGHLDLTDIATLVLCESAHHTGWLYVDIERSRRVQYDDGETRRICQECFEHEEGR